MFVAVKCKFTASEVRHKRNTSVQFVRDGWKIVHRSACVQAHVKILLSRISFADWNTYTCFRLVRVCMPAYASAHGRTLRSVKIRQQSMQRTFYRVKAEERRSKFCRNDCAKSISDKIVSQMCYFLRSAEIKENPAVSKFPMWRNKNLSKYVSSCKNKIKGKLAASCLFPHQAGSFWHWISWHQLQNRKSRENSWYHQKRATCDPGWWNSFQLSVFETSGIVIVGCWSWCCTWCSRHHQLMTQVQVCSCWCVSRTGDSVLSALLCCKWLVVFQPSNLRHHLIFESHSRSRAKNKLESPELVASRDFRKPLSMTFSWSCRWLHDQHFVGRNVFSKFDFTTHFFLRTSRILWCSFWVGHLDSWALVLRLKYLPPGDGSDHLYMIVRSFKCAVCVCFLFAAHLFASGENSLEVIDRFPRRCRQSFVKLLVRLASVNLRETAFVAAGRSTPSSLFPSLSTWTIWKWRNVHYECVKLSPGCVCTIPLHKQRSFLCVYVLEFKKIK